MWFSLHFAGEWGSEWGKCLSRPHITPWTQVSAPLHSFSPAPSHGISPSPPPHHLSSMTTCTLPSRCREVCVRENTTLSCMDFHPLEVHKGTYSRWHFWLVSHFGSCEAEGTERQSHEGCRRQCSHSADCVFQPSRLYRFIGWNAAAKPVAFLILCVTSS